MKYIKNPPTLDELKSLYDSEVYQNLIKELEADNIKFVQDELGMRLINMLSFCQKNAIQLNIPFAELEADFHKNTKRLIKFTKAKISFFDEIGEEDIDGEIPEGEELGEENKSEVIETLGYSKIILLNDFYEFYLLKLDDKDRLLHYLKRIGTPYAEKYLGQIKTIYKQISNETI